jgi:hypothetical protein
MENEIVQDRNYYNNTKTERNPALFKKLLFGIVTLGLLNCSQLFSSPFPHCHEEIEVIFGKGWVFPDTWTCPSCGYENYEGIRSCALCGQSASMMFIIEGETSNDY